MRNRPIEFTRNAFDRGTICAAIPDMSLRNRLKPFVFLDQFETRRESPFGLPYHPHSGVGTFTYTRTADLHHRDTQGEQGVVPAGSVQWMAAGNGIWHEEMYVPQGTGVKGMQLWLQLPPELENAAPSYQVASAQALPTVGPVTVLAGAYEAVESPMALPWKLNYFWVSLKPGEAWRFEPPIDHDVAWLYVAERSLAEAGNGQLAVYSREPGALELHAGPEGAGFVVGTAAGSEWPIVASRTSMHTSAAALARGAARIQELRDRV